jgi:hypothetical protein|nr:MAG TPA: Protein of unknown function (DUF1064) [Caudoviricetes sp.]
MRYYSNKVKPIETQYHGYRFRSRLEARWAVFFDVMGIKYEYEKEGFELSSGRYLPDFWLPEWEVWFEVKPSFPETEELYKLQELCIETGYAALCSEGMPKEEFSGVCFVYGSFVDDSVTDNPAIEPICLNMSSFFISNYPDGDEEAWLFLEGWDSHYYYKKNGNKYVQYPKRPFIQIQGDEDYIKCALKYGRFARAIEKAKSARFEFGERGE